MSVDENPSNLEAGIREAPKRSFSVSEATEVAGDKLEAPFFLKWIEYPFHVANPETGQKLPEACGWAMDSAGRGPLNQVGGYIGSAILRLALYDAGCIAPGPCDAKVLGGSIKPSSLLTLTSALVGFVAAILMPIVGAVVDHTTYRRTVGAVSGFFAVLFTGLQITIQQDPNVWLFILILDALQTFALLVHTTAVFAYLPDLSLKQDITSHYASRFNARQYVAQFVFVGAVILLGQLRDSNRSLNSTVKTAREGASLAFGFGFVFIGYAWLFLFRSRPALSNVPDDQTLLNTGFKQVMKSSRKIWSRYRALKWFMISLLWSPEAGAGVIQSIVVTFLTVHLKFSALDLAKMNLILISGNVVGSYFAKFVCRMVNPLNSYRLALTSLAVSIAAGIYVADGPDKRGAIFGFSSVWGICMGWVYPSQRVLFCTLIPKGQETEMMGLFVFAGQVIGWLPPLLFTIMNEKDVPVRYGVGLVSIFTFVAVIFTLPMGNYDRAVQLAFSDSEDKLKEVVSKSVHISSGNMAATQSSLPASQDLQSQDAEN